MLRKAPFPILEFDDARHAALNPDTVNREKKILPSNMLVITFFKEVVQNLLTEGRIKACHTIKGENEVIIYQFTESKVLLMHGIVGCPACGGILDELTGLGIRKVMFCGGGGVLDPNIKVGELLVVKGAIRDEGFSYHYIEPSRVIYAQKDVKEKITAYLGKNDLPFIEGLVWTTDAIFRETRERVQLRRAEGAKIVEMEQAGCIAVAQFRDIKYGAIIYGGDDVSGEVWDKRGWTDRKSIRHALVDICSELVKEI